VSRLFLGCAFTETESSEIADTVHRKASKKPGGEGGVPIKVGDDTIGGIAAAGALGGDKDEACAIAGINRIKDRLN
jgi:uncharacterized protein GlcG (DUF336 family)